MDSILVLIVAFVGFIFLAALFIYGEIKENQNHQEQIRLIREAYKR